MDLDSYDFSMGLLTSKPLLFLLDLQLFSEKHCRLAILKRSAKGQKQLRVWLFLLAFWRICIGFASQTLPVTSRERYCSS